MAERHIRPPRPGHGFQPVHTPAPHTGRRRRRRHRWCMPNRTLLSAAGAVCRESQSLHRPAPGQSVDPSVGPLSRPRWDSGSPDRPAAARRAPPKDALKDGRRRMKDGRTGAGGQGWRGRGGEGERGRGGHRHTSAAPPPESASRPPFRGPTGLHRLCVDPEHAASSSTSTGTTPVTQRPAAAERRVVRRVQIRLGSNAASQLQSCAVRRAEPQHSPLKLHFRRRYVEGTRGK